MLRKPNEELPSPMVPHTYVPGGSRHPVQTGQTWASIAAMHAIDPWDLIDFNFPGLKRLKAANVQQATRQTNWYLREYVGCNATTDGENWAFTSRLTTGKGVWQGGVIYIPQKTPPPQPVHRCSPTGGSMRRPTFYRPLNQKEQDLVRGVFGSTLPHWTTIGIGNGLGAEGRPWTDTGPMTYSQMPFMHYQINIGDAASADLTSTTHVGCFITDINGTAAELLVHEMTHVWQYHNARGRYGVWASSITGSYSFTPGDPWNDYDVEQQASIVEQWYKKRVKEVGCPISIRSAVSTAPVVLISRATSRSTNSTAIWRTSEQEEKSSRSTHLLCLSLSICLRRQRCVCCTPTHQGGRFGALL